jgi:hypothetical protein
LNKLSDIPKKYTLSSPSFFFHLACQNAELGKRLARLKEGGVKVDPAEKEQASKAYGTMMVSFDFTLLLYSFVL